MRIFILFILLITSQVSFSQDLIQNGGFEKYHDPFINITLVSHAKKWSTVFESTPDLLTSKNLFKWLNYGKKGTANVEPFKGKSCAGMIIFSLEDNMYNYHEFMQNKLKYALKKDSLYYLSMMVLFRDESLLVTDKLQAYFSNSKFKHESDYLKLDSNYIIDIQNGEFLYHTNWVRICGIYKAKGNEKYITIGNFMKLDDIKYLSNTSQCKVNRKEIDKSSYVLIDNVSLVPIKNSSKCNCTIKRLSVDKVQNNDILNQNNNYKKQNIILLLENLHFATNSFKIDTNSIEELDHLYSILEGDTSLKICINGHTDSEGNVKSNQRLSERRAKSVAEYLIDKGIDQDRIIYKGYGASYPISTNETEEGRAKNRRVEVEFK